MKEDLSRLFPDERKEHLNESVLRQSQLVMLRILKVVDFICRKHRLIYWLDAGTLLGAVRHKGFIPWDDDIDIVMPREDYNKFIEVAKAELPGDLFLQDNLIDEEYYVPWVKIRDTKSKIREYKIGNYHRGIFIDVFPMDSYDKDAKEINSLRKRYKLYHVALTIIKESLEPMSSVKQIMKNIIKIILKAIFFPLALRSRKEINNMSNNLRDKYVGFLSSPNGKNIGYGIDVMFWNTLIVSKDTVFPLKELQFEDSKFYVPNNYDLYLKNLFGNYMELPPEDKRIPHNLELEPVLNEKS